MMNNDPLRFIGAVLTLTIAFGCTKKGNEFYTASDFGRVPKTDVHFHYNTWDVRFVEFADSLNFRLVSPNTDAGMSIDEQFEIAAFVKKQYPENFAFLGTFGVGHYGSESFSDSIISRIRACMEAGASGIKIWKNIGMALKDENGRFVMADEEVFSPVFRFLEGENIPVMAHLGEPKNCWLPLDEMTLDNDRGYFSRHPEYHMYLHPEAPSYDDQVAARDNLLGRYPGIDFTGAHLGSLEWNVDELAKRFDRFPQFVVDMSARIGHLQYQSAADYEKVRNFLIRYHDRIMYGTDVSVSARDTNLVSKCKSLANNWMNDWLYLATDTMVTVKNLGDKQVQGLKLPRDVIDRIYHQNADRFFSAPQTVAQQLQ